MCENGPFRSNKAFRNPGVISQCMMAMTTFMEKKICQKQKQNFWLACRSNYVNYLCPNHIKESSLQSCIYSVAVTTLIEPDFAGGRDRGYARTLEGGLVHAGHAGAVVLTREPLDVDLEGDGPNRRAEVKQTHLFHGEQEEEEKKGDFNRSSCHHEAPSGSSAGSRRR